MSLNTHGQAKQLKYYLNFRQWKKKNSDMIKGSFISTK